MTKRDITKNFEPVAFVHQIPMEPLFEAAFKDVGPLYIVQPRGAIRSYGFLVHTSADRYFSRDAFIRSPAREAFGGLRMDLEKSLNSFQRVRYFNVLTALCKKVGVQHLIEDSGYDLRSRGITRLSFYQWDGRSERYLASHVESHWKENNPHIPFKHAFELVRRW